MNLQALREGGGVKREKGINFKDQMRLRHSKKAFEKKRRQISTARRGSRSRKRRRRGGLIEMEAKVKENVSRTGQHRYI